MRRVEREVWRQRAEVITPAVVLLVGLLLVLLSAHGVFAADPAPRFVVTNRCPPKFEVVNRTAPACVCGPACACTANPNCGCGLVHSNPAPPLYAAPAAFQLAPAGGCAGGVCQPQYVPARRGFGWR